MKSAAFLPLLFLLGAPLPAPAWERVFDFEKDDENFPPEGMMVETPPGGKALVAVQRDPDAPSKSHVLVMRGAPFPGVNSLLCLAWFSHVANGSVEVRLKHGGEEEVQRTAGLVWRCQSAADTYTLEWDTRKSILILAVVTQGKRKVLEKEKAELPPNQWSALRVDFQNSTFQCRIDGRTVLTAKDSHLSEPGRVGLFLQSDVTMFFDQFRIRGED